MSTTESLHLPPAVAAALERLGWDAGTPTVREAVPTVARGHNLVAVLPPAPVHAVPILAGLLGRLGGAGGRGLILPPASQLTEWGGEASRIAAGSGLRIQVAQGTARAARRLKAEGIDLLIATPETALALHRRSALGVEGLAWVLLAWPESWEDEAGLTPVMQDLSREAQRVVVTALPDRAAELVERYARRALTLGAQAAVAEPAGPVRVAVVSWERRAAALAELVELLDPATLVVWTADRGRHEEIGRHLAAGDSAARVVTGDAPRADLVVAFDPPTPERLRQLLGAGEVVLLAPPDTLAYLERIAAPRRPLRLPGVLDALTTEAGVRRATIARALEAGRPERGLLTLAPLFERYDPAAVAAALFELWTAAGQAAAAPAPVPDIPATARVYVGIGKKDGATVNDLVAVLTKEVRYERQRIGRVELRDAFALVEVPAQDAERVAAALNGVSIRRKRVSARVDRGTARPPRSGRPVRRQGG